MGRTVSFSTATRKNKSNLINVMELNTFFPSTQTVKTSTHHVFHHPLIIYAIETSHNHISFWKLQSLSLLAQQRKAHQDFTWLGAIAIVVFFFQLCRYKNSAVEVVTFRINEGHSQVLVLLLLAKETWRVRESWSVNESTFEFPPPEWENTTVADDF